jgi:hypothetical protein
LQALLDTFFALGLLLIVWLLAVSLGCKVQGWLRLERPDRLEKILFALPLGLGILAYGILALGLLGLLYPPVVLLWLILAGTVAWKELHELLSGLPEWVREAFQTLRRLEKWKKLVLAASGLIFFLALLQALSPPWDYDGLMYHLEGPRLFLEHHRIFPSSARWWINCLYHGMLYLIGLSSARHFCS